MDTTGGKYYYRFLTALDLLDLTDAVTVQFAIRSGNASLVKFLLDSGASKDCIIGQRQTSPLQWAIWNQQLDVVRFLLDSGASQDHVNSWGWNAAFFCWPYLECGHPSTVAYLRMLDERAVLDLGIVDTEGWTVLHRAAAYGTAEEVGELIKLGADPKTAALPLRWNAMHHAVFYGNNPTFEKLLPLFEETLLDMTDERGWTLLHIAASAGHDTIVRYLLSTGSNPTALSNPFRSHMPANLFGRRCTPAEVAAAQSNDRLAQYLRGLEDCGLDSGLMTGINLADEEDLFFDAAEHAS